MFISVLLATCFFGIVHNVAVVPPLPSEQNLPFKSPVTSEQPVPSVSPLPSEAPVPSLSTVPSLSPVPSESPNPSVLPVPSVSPVPSGSPPPSESPVPSDLTVPSVSPLPSRSPLPSESPILSDLTVPSVSPVPSRSPLPSESPIPSDLTVPSVSPVPSGSHLPSESPIIPELPIPSGSPIPKELSKNLEHVKYYLHRYGSLTEKRLGTAFDKIGSLEIRLSQISRLSNETFKQLVNLESMTFLFSKLRTRVIKDVFSNCCPKLKYLKINHCYGFNEEDIKGIGTLPLEYLEIIEVDIPKLKSGVFQGTKLKSLILSRNNMEEIEEGAFDGLDKLEFLHISYNKIEEIPKKALGNLKSLKSLELGSNQVHFFGTDYLPEMPNLSDILFISENITRLNFLYADTVAPKLKDVYLIGYYPNHIPAIRGPLAIHMWL